MKTKTIQITDGDYTCAIDGCDKPATKATIMKMPDGKLIGVRTCDGCLARALKKIGVEL